MSRIVHHTAIIGAPPCVYARGEGGARPYREPVDHGVDIAGDVDLLAYVVVVSGTERATVVGRGSRLLHRAHVGHDCIVGEDCMIGASALLGGFSEVGDRTELKMRVTVRNRVRIGSDCMIGMGSVIVKDVPDNTKIYGVPPNQTVAQNRHDLPWRSPSMGEEAEAHVYDAGFLRNPRYLKDPIDAPWYPIWKAVADMIPPQASVLDLGCGPGHLACLIGKRETYIGIDFSMVAIAMARVRSPWADWRVADLRTCEFPTTRVVVCTETMEHIKRDLRVLKKVKRGRRVILSVPTYDSRTHVRFFETMGKAKRRFGKLIKLERCFKVGERHFVLSGLRN